jgi:hypothetical protein
LNGIRADYKMQQNGVLITSLSAADLWHFKSVFYRSRFS